jgi:hypothetical protein
LRKKWLIVVVAGLALVIGACSARGALGDSNQAGQDKTAIETRVPASRTAEPTQELATGDDGIGDTGQPAGDEPTTPDAAELSSETTPAPEDGAAAHQIPVDERLTVLEEVNDFLDALPAAAGGADSQEIADYLAARPEFTSAGVSADGAVWGEFVDGRMFFVVNNRPVAAEAESAHRPASPPDQGLSLSLSIPLLSMIAPVLHLPAWQSASQLAVVQENGGGLPKSDRAHVLSAMGTYYAGAQEAQDKLQAWLNANGYQIMAGDATVDELKAVNGGGVFFFSTHGGTVGNIEGKGVYGLWTSTRIDAFNETRFVADLDTGRIAYAAAPQDRNPAYDRALDADCQGNDCVKPYLYATHYAITAEFVKKYMSFAENSFVFVDACSSDTNDMKQAFLGKPGVSLYVGWTGSVGDGFSARAARFLFDGLLGTNEEPPEEKPKVRPFDYHSVYQYMQREKKVVDPGTGATLKLTDSNPGFAILRPSIQHLEVKEETGELFIFGMFGSEAGEVMIDGQRALVTNWQPDLVVADLPDKGPGSAGDVIVKVRKHESPAVPLTEWRGQMRYSENADTLAPNLNTVVDMQVHFRGDVHAFRDQPWKQPQDREVKFVLAGDSRAHYTMSGSSVVDGTKFDLAGSGDLLTISDQPDHDGTHFDLFGILHVQGIQEGKPPDIAQVYLHMHLAGEPGESKLTMTLPNGMTQETPFGIMGTDVLSDQTLTLDDAYNILDGHLESNTVQGMPALGLGVWEWDQLDASFAPSLSDPPYAWQPLAGMPAPSEGYFQVCIG